MRQLPPKTADRIKPMTIVVTDVADMPTLIVMRVLKPGVLVCFAKGQQEPYEVPMDRIISTYCGVTTYKRSPDDTERFVSVYKDGERVGIQNVATAEIFDPPNKLLPAVVHF